MPRCSFTHHVSKMMLDHICPSKGWTTDPNGSSATALEGRERRSPDNKKGCYKKTSFFLRYFNADFSWWNLLPPWAMNPYHQVAGKLPPPLPFKGTGSAPDWRLCENYSFISFSWGLWLSRCYNWPTMLAKWCLTIFALWRDERPIPTGQVRQRLKGENGDRRTIKRVAIRRQASFCALFTHSIS